MCVDELIYPMYRGDWRRRVEWKQIRLSGSRWKLTAAIVGIGAFLVQPAILYATHEADHRFTVEGFVCGADGKPSANVEVLVKDTRISYGQTVATGEDGYYRAAFHLHNDNLGDPLLVEARGEQQNIKIQFDPKDLESERKVQVNFGSGCIHDRSAPPAWLFVGLGVFAGIGGLLVWIKVVRFRRKKGARLDKGQGKRKK